MHARSVVVGVAVGLVGLGAQVPAFGAPGPQVAFEDSSVVVDGLAPGAEAVLLGVGRGISGFLPYQVSFAELVTADAAGAVRLELERPMPEVSVWVAVALADGAYTLAAPEGSELRQVALPARAIPASLARLEDARRSLQVLWVRPVGSPPAEVSGGWTARVDDGSALDGDGGENRRLAVVLDLLAPIGASPAPPAKVAAGDVLVGVDVETLEVYAVRLGA